MKTPKEKKEQREKRGIGHFLTPSWQEQYCAAYDELLAEMPKPTNTLDIATSWGIVRVYEWANNDAADKPPVVLLPGRSSGVPMWNENLPSMMANHTVYAADALGDAGKSYQTVPFGGYEDMVNWISEMIAELKIGKVHLVGHSFGGGFAANVALGHPEQTVTVSLLEPAFALNYPSVSILFWATIGSMEFLPKSWRDYALARMTGEEIKEMESDAPMARMISAASAGYAAYLPTPKTLSDKEIETLTMPVYVALGGKSPITGKKAPKSARKIKNATIQIFDEATHSLPMEYQFEIGEALNDFWAQNE